MKQHINVEITWLFTCALSAGLVWHGSLCEKVKYKIILAYWSLIKLCLNQELMLVSKRIFHKTIVLNGAWHVTYSWKKRRPLENMFCYNIWTSPWKHEKDICKLFSHRVQKKIILKKKRWQWMNQHSVIIYTYIYQVGPSNSDYWLEGYTINHLYLLCVW